MNKGRYYVVGTKCATRENSLMVAKRTADSWPTDTDVVDTETKKVVYNNGKPFYLN